MANFDFSQYWSAEDLLYDVKNNFVKDGRYFPPEAEDLIKERFQYRRIYEEMQRREDEQQKIANFIGGGQIYQSISDEIVDDLRNPRAEILDIDMTQYATTREGPLPEDITKFVKRVSFTGRLSGLFRRIFRRG